ISCCIHRGKFEISFRSSGQWVTQTESQSAVPGQNVSIECIVNPSIYTCFTWYLQKQGDALKPLFNCKGIRQSGVPDRFSKGGPGFDFTLRISGVQPEDAAVYICQSCHFYAFKLVFTQ
uniref:Ig-like domain-containing protein n=1 Tax=Cyprinodon variegatus TaxID=28743 RepID=A0A3Q2CBF5_CYPVA